MITVCNEQVAERIYCYALWQAQSGLCGGPSITAVASRPIPRDRDDDAGSNVDLADAIVVTIRYE